MQPQDQQQPAFDTPTAPSLPLSAPPIDTSTAVPMPAQPAMATVDPQVLRAGMQVMAKGPAVNAGFAVCQVVDNPENPQDPIIEFPDGSRFYSSTVVVGGIVNNTPAPAAPMSPLRPEYARFQDALVRLDQHCQDMFKLPLDMLVLMIQRNAMQNALPSSGHMEIVGGQSTFVPDQETMSRWTESYLLTVQRREQEQAGTTAE